MAEPSIQTLVTRLFDDSVAVAKAEVAVVRARILTRVDAAKTGAILLVAAALVAILGLVGLVVGIVLALAPLVGAALAGVIVLVAALVIAAILGAIGARRLSAKPDAAGARP